MKHEGYIKFECRLTEGDCLDEAETADLTEYRKRLHALGLVGMDDNGIGYGNISARHKSGRGFIVSGTQTGTIRELEPCQYAFVTGWDYGKNILECRGRIKASSESLTHAAVYDALPEVNSVIHVHSRELWTSARNILPTTPSDAEFGTTRLALSVIMLLQKSRDKDKGIIVMGGHEDGIIAYGRNVMEAYHELLRISKYMSDSSNSGWKGNLTVN